MLSDKELEVLSYILANVQKGGVFKGTLDELSRATGIDKKELKQVLEELVAKDYITIINTRSVLHRLSINIEDIVTCIDSLFINKYSNCKNIIGDLQIYNNSYKYRNNLLREIEKISNVEDFNQIINELYRIERVLKRYRTIIETEIRSIFQKNITSIMPSEEKLLLRHKLIAKCFPLLINSIERVSREELSPNEIEVLGINKTNLNHIYKIDEELLDIMITRYNQMIKEISSFIKNKKLDKTTIMKALYIIFSLKKDIELINLIKEAIHGMQYEK